MCAARALELTRGPLDGRGAGLGLVDRREGSIGDTRLLCFCWVAGVFLGEKPFFFSPLRYS